MITLKQFREIPLLLRIETTFFFLTILLLPTQFGKHFWPSFAYIYSIRTDYFSPVIYLWDLLVIFLLFFGVIRKELKPILGLTSFLLFLFAQLGSFFISSNLGASFVRFEQYFLVGIWGLYIANSKLPNVKAIMWWGLGLALIWSSIIGIGQSLAGRTLGFWVLGERSFDLDTISIATFDWYDQVFLRPYATFPHPNVLAAFLLIGIILFEWLKGKKKEVHSWFYSGVLLLSSAALFLTFSRVAAGLFSVVLLYFFRKRLKLLLVIFLLLLPFLFVRFHSAFNFDQLSVIRREELAVAAIELWKSSPLFGIGLNNFIYDLAEGRIVSGEVRFFQPVHMIFLLALSETGILGLIGLIALFNPMVLLLRKVKDSNRFKMEYVILLYGWVCVVVMGVFDHFFLTLAQGLRVFFLIWGISMLQYYGEYRKKNRQPNRISAGR